MSVFTKKGRLKRKLKRRMKWKSSRKDFRRIRKDAKGVKEDEEEEKHLQETINEAMKMFDADEVTDDMELIIETFTEEHELLRDMLRIANTENMRLMKEVGDLQKRLSEYQSNHPDQQEIGDIKKEVDGVLQRIQETLREERKRARRVLQDRQRVKDKSLLPFSLIYYRIRRNARMGKKDAKHLKKLEKHVKKTLDELNKEQPDEKELHKTLKEMHKDLKSGEKEMLDEVKELAHIEQYVQVLQFRESAEDIQNMEEKLKQADFPQYKIEEIEKKLREAFQKLQEVEKEEKTESKGVYKTAKAA